MIKRTLYFSNPAYLRRENEQLTVTQKDGPKETKKSIPIEDIGMVVIDHQQITITHGALNALVDNNAAVLWCDEKHMPNGLVLPMTANHTFTEKLRHQLNASEPLKKNLWKQTVQQKITNQAILLEQCGRPACEHLFQYAKDVLSGDTTNVEATAANLYWQELFELPEKFKRQRHGSSPNHLLNYGYAILRSVVARSLVSSGMLPALGIYHRNKYNAFCLADDIMEPYRPFVDRIVVDILEELEQVPEELSLELKTRMLKIPTLDIEIDGNKSPLMVGMQRTTASLMDCFEGSTRKILYPRMQ